jgi:(p)ppGpp synthase/HD superfamily hydrolase
MIASQAHLGQQDRYGEPYILHPFRVMMKMNDDNEKITAILHDVIEDTDINLSDLRQEGFDEDIIHAIDCISKREDEAYADYIERTAESRLAVRVKIADLEDNMDLRRLSEINEKDILRMKKYHRAWLRLQKEI